MTPKQRQRQLKRMASMSPEEKKEHHARRSLELADMKFRVVTEFNPKYPPSELSQEDIQNIREVRGILKKEENFRSRLKKSLSMKEKVKVAKLVREGSGYFSAVKLVHGKNSIPEKGSEATAPTSNSERAKTQPNGRIRATICTAVTLFTIAVGALVLDHFVVYDSERGISYRLSDIFAMAVSAWKGFFAAIGLIGYAGIAFIIGLFTLVIALSPLIALIYLIVWLKDKR